MTINKLATMESVDTWRDDRLCGEWTQAETILLTRYHVSTY